MGCQQVALPLRRGIARSHRMKTTAHISLLLPIVLAGCVEHVESVGVDAGTSELDAAIGSDSDAGPLVGSEQAIRYPAGLTQSPITPFVAERLREISSARSSDTFAVAKVGDSITVSNQFFHCFAGSPDSIDSDIDKTVSDFTGFDRTSLAAGVGWSSNMPISGSPSPLQREIDTIDPAAAIVMYGTNDAEGGNLDAFGGNLLTIVDTLIESGVVPIVSTIPPRSYNANDVRVPFYNAMARAVAAARQVPLVDLHRELAALPDYGLGGDGLHPRGVGGGCDFSASGMQGGYNVRNRVSIEALDRVRRILDGSEESFDADAPRWLGEGTRNTPYEVPLDSLPFTHAGNTLTSDERNHDTYSCSTANEGGSEVWYQLRVEESKAVRITLSDRDDVDVDVHLLSGGTEASSCTSRDDRTIDATLPPGDHFIVVDTYVSGGIERSGEFLLTISST